MDGARPSNDAGGVFYGNASQSLVSVLTPAGRFGNLVWCSSRSSRREEAQTEWAEVCVRDEPFPARFRKAVSVSSIYGLSSGPALDSALHQTKLLRYETEHFGTK